MRMLKLEDKQRTSLHHVLFKKLLTMILQKTLRQALRKIQSCIETEIFRRTINIKSFAEQ